jgi:magnesium transporter
MHEGAGVTYVGFVLSEKLLLTVRFATMPAFDLIARRARAEADARAAPWDILLRIVEKIVDLTADRLETIAAALAEISHATFRADGGGTDADSLRRARRRRSPALVSLALRGALRRLGTIGDLLWEVRDSMTGMLRIAHRLADEHSAALMGTGQPRVEPIMLDLKSLSDTREQLSGKVQFLLDATLGFINIEQNDIVQTLTVASVAGIPPVLVAGIYGMNFQHMPELSWHLGYPLALALIVISGIVPVYWFKARGWM